MSQLKLKLSLCLALGVYKLITDQRIDIIRHGGINIPINTNFKFDWSPKHSTVNTNILATMKSIMLKTYNGCRGHCNPLNLLNLAYGYWTKLTATLDGVFGGLE